MKTKEIQNTNKDSIRVASVARNRSIALSCNGRSRLPENALTRLTTDSTLHELK